MSKRNNDPDTIYLTEQAQNENKQITQKIQQMNVF